MQDRSAVVLSCIAVSLLWHSSGWLHLLLYLRSTIYYHRLTETISQKSPQIYYLFTYLQLGPLFAPQQSVSVSYPCLHFII